MTPTGYSATVIFTPDDADGTRARIGVVGVDSGTMEIAGDWFADLDRVPYDGVVGNIVVSPTGYGDGQYSVLGVRDPSSALLGVEVVFFCTTIEDEAAREACERGAALSDAILAAIWDHTATDAQQETYARNRAIFYDCWDRLENLVHPADDSAPRVLGTISVESCLEIGDPCHRDPTCTVGVPAGRYAAVAWEADGHTARLAVYRLRKERQTLSRPRSAPPLSV